MIGWRTMKNKRLQQYKNIVKSYRKKMPHNIVDALFSTTTDSKNPVLKEVWIKSLSVILKKTGRIKMSLSTGEIMELKIS